MQVVVTCWLSCPPPPPPPPPPNTHTHTHTHKKREEGNWREGEEMPDTTACLVAFTFNTAASKPIKFYLNFLKLIRASYFLRHCLSTNQSSESILFACSLALPSFVACFCFLEGRGRLFSRVEGSIFGFLHKKLYNS